MPELPEVETIRRQLEREFVGKKIKSVDVTEARSIRRHKETGAFTARLEGAKLKSLQRRGKYLQFTLDTGDLLVFHLGMSGQLRKAGPKDELVKHTHLVFHFTQGPQLRFIDPRTFGEVFVVTKEEVPDVEEYGQLGIDVVDNPVSWTHFARMVLGRRMKLKALLMDQSIIAGIGNIYSDEILHDSGLRYDRPSDSLTIQEVRRLYRAVVEILHDGIKHGGSTLADGGYVDLNGKTGGYAEFHQVYARDGQACRRCRGVIAKDKFQGRTTYFCPSCQV